LRGIAEKIGEVANTCDCISVNAVLSVKKGLSKVKVFCFGRRGGSKSAQAAEKSSNGENES
jgi:hypothetical protein